MKITFCFSLSFLALFFLFFFLCAGSGFFSSMFLCSRRMKNDKKKCFSACFSIRAKGFYLLFVFCRLLLLLGEISAIGGV